ncbi:unnamed protein product [Arabidopsis lyrata]|nr:unnamed protein product [Arabidopsis lyrata]
MLVKDSSSCDEFATGGISVMGRALQNQSNPVRAIPQVSVSISR